MSEREMYRAEIVIDIRGDQQTVNRVRTIDRFMDQTRRRAEVLNRIKVSPAVQLIDRVSSPLKKIESNLGRLANSTKRVTIEAVDKTGSVLKKIKGAITSPLGILGIGAAGLGAGALIGGSIVKAMNFEAQMSSIKALTGLADKEMMEMQSLAMKMGSKTKYSALEAAQGMEELLKAGITPAQVKAGALEAALNLATAGSLDLAEAAEIMSTSLNAFKADGLTAAAASDILAGTANASATSVKEVAYALSQVSSVASGYGMTLKDTNIALGLFANNGLKGSDAGTSLKTMLSNLQPTTKEQIALFSKLGIATGGTANKFFTAEGKLQSLESISGTLQDSLKGLTDQQRMLYLETMFGSDAIRAANILYKEGSAGVKKFKEEMSKVTALNVAKEKMNNASGAVEQFKGAMETLQISAMYPFLSTIKKVAEGAANLTDKVGPRITASMENAARKVEDFFNRLSADEKFQQLSWGEKINYALSQIVQALDAWMAGEGGVQVKAFGEQMGKMISIGLDGAAPILIKSAGTAGKILGEAMVSAFGAALSSSPIGAIIIGALGGAAVGSVVPGAGTAVGAVAGGGAGFISWVGSKVLDAVNPPEKHATGGILTRPHLGLVAEAGPEAIIPLSGRMRNRALSIWQETGKMLGVTPHAEGGIFGGFFGNIMDSIKSFFSNDAVSNASNYTESSAIALESTNMGMEKAVEGIHENYSKKIAKADDFEEAYKARGIGHGARDLANKYGKATKMFSRVALPLGLFSSIAQIMAAKDKRAAIVRELGSTAGAIVMGALMGAGTGALVGAGVISPLTAMLGTVIGAGLGAFGGQAAATKFSSWARHHATGGIMTSPHIGLVGEAGPEAIIPLSQRYRNRALGLWQQVGNSLGAQPQIAGAGGITVQHNGDININGGGDIDYDAMALKIGWKFVEKIQRVLENR